MSNFKVYDVRVNRKKIGIVIKMGKQYGAYNLQGKLLCSRDTKKECVEFLKGEEN